MKSGQILVWRKTQPTDEQTAWQMLLKALSKALARHNAYMVRKHHRKSIMEGIARAIDNRCNNKCEFIIITQ